jgi:photosystem II stability/assembly factor-like uncharacterized protein
MNEKRQTYCRSIREVPGDSKSIWVSAGANFQSDEGALFRTQDGGLSWDRVDMGFQPTSTMFGLAFDHSHPSNMFCASNRGQVWGSTDGGDSWEERSLPSGAIQVYSIACG